MVGCESTEDRRLRCGGSLRNLVTWRNSIERQRFFEGKEFEPAWMAQEELTHVESTVAEMAQAGTDCKSLWQMMLLQQPTSPPLRLQEEAILRALDAPSHRYTSRSIGLAGVDTHAQPPDDGP